MVASRISGGTLVNVLYDSNAADQFKIITAGDGYDLIGAFSGASSSSLCPVTTVKAYVESGGSFSLADANSIKLDVSNQLNVNQKSVLATTRIYIVGFTAANRDGLNHYGAGGSSSGYFFLDVKVGCGKETITASIGT